MLLCLCFNSLNIYEEIGDSKENETVIWPFGAESQTPMRCVSHKPQTANLKKNTCCPLVPVFSTVYKFNYEFFERHQNLLSASFEFLIRFLDMKQYCHFQKCI